MRPRRAAEAFWRCEQAFERRTRDIVFFFLPVYIFSSCFVLSEGVRDDRGALGGGFRGIGVEGIECRRLAGWSTARSRRRANILLVGAMNRGYLPSGLAKCVD